MHPSTKQTITKYLRTTQGLAQYLGERPETIKTWAYRNKIDYILIPDSTIHLYDLRDFVSKERPKRRVRSDSGKNRIKPDNQ